MSDATPSVPSDPYSESIDAFLRAHLQSIEGRIRARARDLAKDDGRERVEVMDIAAAAKEYAPGRPVPEGRAGSEEVMVSEVGIDSIERKSSVQNPLTFKDRILSSISGITLISAALAILFGLIGYFGIRTGAESVQGFIDIAQIFAGAVVGSTGAAVAPIGTPLVSTGGPASNTQQP